MFYEVAKQGGSLDFAAAEELVLLWFIGCSFPQNMITVQSNFDYTKTVTFTSRKSNLNHGKRKRRKKNKHFANQDGIDINSTQYMETFLRNQQLGFSSCFTSDGPQRDTDTKTHRVVFDSVEDAHTALQLRATNSNYPYTKSEFDYEIVGTRSCFKVRGAGNYNASSHMILSQETVCNLTGASTVVAGNVLCNQGKRGGFSYI